MESRAQLVVPDAMLVARLSRGDLSAFEELYERYAREVFVLAAHALGRRDAEEVVQDVFPGSGKGPGGSIPSGARSQPGS